MSVPITIGSTSVELPPDHTTLIGNPILTSQGAEINTSASLPVCGHHTSLDGFLDQLDYPSNLYDPNTPSNFLLSDFGRTGDDHNANEEEANDAYLIPRRTLRSQAGFVNFGTWLDEDESGDYDPEQERRQARKKRRRLNRDARFGVAHGQNVNSRAADDQKSPSDKLAGPTDGSERSLRCTGGLNPCTECAEHGFSCTTGQLTSNPAPKLPNQPRVTSKEPKEQAVNLIEQYPTIIPPAVQHSPNSLTSSTYTSFAHPIIFNYSPEAGLDCLFCSTPVFAIVGLGRRRVSVRDTEDRSGWIETSGGHRVAAGIDSTEMCVLCTTRRLQILLCEKHDIRQIAIDEPSLQLELLDIGSLLEDGEHGQIERCCSLCPSLAQYECGTTVDEEEQGGECGAGCGLKLCERCMLALAGLYDGQLSAMLGQVNYQPSEDRPFGFRADCEFLQDGGPLAKYVAWMSQ